VLSDDAALLVRGADGETWAHPWPTWGAVLSEVEGASWEVGRAVPLGAICFLSKSSQDAAQRIREGEAVCLAVETMEQLLPTLTKGLSEDEKRSVRMQQFHNLCALLRGVQAFHLGVRRHGRFWEALEAALMSETLQASGGMER
jgi:SynChlorMet cassette protein ScmC